MGKLTTAQRKALKEITRRHEEGKETYAIGNTRRMLDKLVGMGYLENSTKWHPNDNHFWFRPKTTLV